MYGVITGYQQLFSWFRLFSIEQKLQRPKPLVLGLGGSKAQIVPSMCVYYYVDYLILIDAQAISSLAEAPILLLVCFLFI